MKQILNGTEYDASTHPNVIEFLERSRKERNKFRLVIVYGDKMGEVWKNATPDRGFVGRTTGEEPHLPLLIRTSRSLGGEKILDDCIIQLRESSTGCILWDYRHPNLRSYQLAALKIEKL